MVSASSKVTLDKSAVGRQVRSTPEPTVKPARRGAGRWQGGDQHMSGDQLVVAK